MFWDRLPHSPTGARLNAGTPLTPSSSIASSQYKSDANCAHRSVQGAPAEQSFFFSLLGLRATYAALKTLSALHTPAKTGSARRGYCSYFDPSTGPLVFTLGRHRLRAVPLHRRAFDLGTVHLAAGKAVDDHGRTCSDTIVVTGQILGTASSLGSANFGTLIGSNLEMRQSFRIFDRWALQDVAFADAEVFETITARGQRGSPGSAASTDMGVRVMPTFIAEVVLRVDLARILWPDPEFFVQWARSQSF